jgi:hypothetical protein
MQLTYILVQKLVMEVEILKENIKIIDLLFKQNITIIIKILEHNPK